MSGWDTKNLSGLSLLKEQAEELSQDLFEDAKDFYFKGVLSVSEAINAIDRKLFSWATVKLYYSIYYFLRASLASQNIVVLRNKNLYHLKALEGEIPQKSPAKNKASTHESTIAIAKQIIGLSDILLSNDIDGMSSYEWLKDKRERINYREREFHDPNSPDFLQTISERELHKLIDLYVNDDAFIYCFQEDHATLALPIKRWILTREDLLKIKLSLVLTDDKNDLIKNLLTVNGKELTSLISLVNF
jgi:hypothetical protein